MKNIIQIDESDWEEAAEPERIAILPVFTNYFEENANVKFFEFDDALGLYLGAVIKINNIKYYLYTYPEDKSLKERKLIVSILSNESNSEKALLNLINNIEINREDLVWESDDLGPCKWALVRFEKNGCEVEVNRYLNEASVHYMMSKYDENDCENSYMVKQLKYESNR